MATDTKLGLVVGVALVMAVAVVYFPRAAQQPDRATAVVPSLPAASRGTDTALLPAGPSAAARFDRR